MVAAILALLAFGALKAMAPVLIPVVIAIFVTLAVLPLDRALVARLPERFGFLGRAAVMVLLLAVLSVFLGGLAFSATQIATNLPNVPQQIGQLLPPPSSDGAVANALATLRETASGRATSLTERFAGTASSLPQSLAGAMGA